MLQVLLCMYVHQTTIFFCLKAGIYLTIINYVLLSWYKEGLSFNIQIKLLFNHLNNYLSFFFANTNAHYLKAVFQIQFNVEKLNTNTFFFHWNKGLFGVVFKLGISIVLHIYKTDIFFSFNISHFFWHLASSLIGFLFV